MAPYYPKYGWNAKAGRYYGADGRFVTLDEVRAAIDDALIAEGTHAGAFASLVREGKISVFDFANLMRAAIKDSQIYAAAVASGGYSNIDVHGLTELTSRVAEQFKYLEEWIATLTGDLGNDAEQALVRLEEAGKRGISEAQMTARAKMYMSAARGTYEAIYEHAQQRRGFTEYRNRLGHAEHCAQCVDMTAIGWVLIGTLVPIGQRTCLTNCKCHIEYRVR
ncbi:MAG: hypothetical protein ABI119_05955 [Gemmatimonadaceae bacterium]